MVRANKHMNIALSPLNMSPNNYMQSKKSPEKLTIRKKKDINI